MLRWLFPKEPTMAKRKPDDIVNMKVRFTEAMRARIEQEAKKSNRSINGEIVHRLGVSFGAEGPMLVKQFEERTKELAKELDEIVKRIVAERRKG
jgi:hypothetical protein